MHFHQRGNNGETFMTVMDQNGRAVSRTSSAASSGELETPDVSGIYLIRFENAAGVVMVKQLIIP